MQYNTNDFEAFVSNSGEAWVCGSGGAAETAGSPLSHEKRSLPAWLTKSGFLLAALSLSYCQTRVCIQTETLLLDGVW